MGDARLVSDRENGVEDARKGIQDLADILGAGAEVGELRVKPALGKARQLTEMLAGGWGLFVFAALLDSGHRYQDLHDAVDGISHKVLTETLRRAERDGLILRRLDRERIETATLYGLTDLGRSLAAPLAAMAEWADHNWPTVEAARKRWDRLQRATS